MRNKYQKGFVLVLIMLVIAVVALAGAYYFGTLKNKTVLTQVTPAPTASQAPTGDLANWNTYTSKKYNISFKYPNIYQVKEVLVGPNEFYSNAIFVYDTKNGMTETIKIAYEPDFSKLCPTETCIRKSEITIGKNKYTPFMEGQPLVGFYSNRFMILSLLGNVDEKDPVFYQILSTFQFTK